MVFNELWLDRVLEYKGAHFTIRDFLGFLAGMHLEMEDCVEFLPEYQEKADFYAEAYRELARLYRLLPCGL